MTRNKHAYSLNICQFLRHFVCSVAPFKKLNLMVRLSVSHLTVKENIPFPKELVQLVETCEKGCHLQISSNLWNEFRNTKESLRLISIFKIYTINSTVVDPWPLLSIAFGSSVIRLAEQRLLFSSFLCMSSFLCLLILLPNHFSIISILQPPMSISHHASLMADLAHTYLSHFFRVLCFFFMW